MNNLGWDEPKNTFNTVKAFFKEHGFHELTENLSIHSTSSYNFMSRIIGVENWVLEILEHGLKPEFSSTPPPSYEEKKGNNKSAKDNIDFLRSKTEEWVNQGHVIKLATKPDHVHPMTVAQKTNPITKVTKFRPCIDLSWNINLYTIKTKVKLDDLNRKIPREE